MIQHISRSNASVSLESISKQILTPHTTPEPGTEQKSATQLSMQTIRLLGRRSKTLPQHDGNQSPHAIRDGLVAKIVDVGRRIHKWFRQSDNGRNVGVDHAFGLVTREIAQVDGELSTRLAVIFGGGGERFDVLGDKVGRVASRGTKVQELQALRVGVEEEIRPVWVRLHVPEFGDFAETEPKDLGADPIALRLDEGLLRDLRHGNAVEEFHRQDMFPARFGDYLGNLEDRVVLEELSESVHAFGFSGIVALPCQFYSGIRNGLVEE